MKRGKYSIKIVDAGGLDDEPWTRQELVSGWNQELIKNSAASVIGAGALGNEIVKNLVLLGVHKIYVVDFDFVDGSNLSRSVLFRRKDAELRRKKVEAIAERGKELDPYGYIDLIPLHMDITEAEEDHEVFRKPDVIFSAVDSIDVRIHININAYINSKPLIDGGMEAGMGYVQTVIPPYTSCILCSLHQRDIAILNRRLSCRGTPVDLATLKTPAIITTTSMLAGLMVHEYVKIIHGLKRFIEKGEWEPRIGEPLAGKRLYFNLTSNTFIVTEVPVSEKCPLYEYHLKGVSDKPKEKGY